LPHKQGFETKRDEKIQGASLATINAAQGRAGSAQSGWRESAGSRRPQAESLL